MKRLLPFIFLFVLIIGAIIVVPLLLQPERHRPEITAYLTRQLHHPVVIGHIDIGLVPPALQLDDVGVTDVKQSSIVLARVKRLEIRPSWNALLKAKLVPGSVAINGLWLNVQRRVDGSWNWAGASSEPKEASASMPLPAERLVISNSEIHWADPFVPGSPEIVAQAIHGSIEPSHLELQGRLPVGSKPLDFSFNGQATVTGSTVAWSGDLKFTEESRVWSVHVDHKNGIIDAKGESAAWRAEPFIRFITFYCRWEPSGESADQSVPESPVLQNWKNHMTWETGRMTFYQAATLNGGLTEVKGEVTPSGDRASVHLAGAFQEVPMRDLTAAFGFESPIDGKLTGVGRFDVAVASHPWQTLSGQADIEVKDGHYRIPATTLKSLSHAHSADYFKSKFGGALTGGFPFHRMRAHLDAKNGTLSLAEGLVEAGDVRAALTGRIDGARRGIDAYTRLQIHETQPDLIAKIPGHYVYGATGHEEVQPMFGHVQGTWGSWSVRAVTSSRIPGALQERLRKILR